MKDDVIERWSLIKDFTSVSVLATEEWHLINNLAAIIFLKNDTFWGMYVFNSLHTDKFNRNNKKINIVLTYKLTHELWEKKYLQSICIIRNKYNHRNVSILFLAHLQHNLLFFNSIDVTWHIKLYLYCDRKLDNN